MLRLDSGTVLNVLMACSSSTSDQAENASSSPSAPRGLLGSAESSPTTSAISYAGSSSLSLSGVGPWRACNRAGSRPSGRLIRHAGYFVLQTGRELLDIDSLSANPRAYRATHVAALDHRQQGCLWGWRSRVATLQHGLGQRRWRRKSGEC